MPDATVAGEVSEPQFAALVDAIAADPARRGQLAGLLREDHAIYAGRGTTAIARMRGWILLAMARAGVPDAALVFVLEELDSGTERRLRGSTSTGVEIHLGPAVAIFFFNDMDFGRPANCYLLEKAARRLDPFLPVIEKLAMDGASPLVATLTLNMLEVVPQPHHLSLLIKALAAWLDAYSVDRAFWVDQGIGRRGCILIDAIRKQEPAAILSQTNLRGALDHILAALVTLGVPEARRLELELAKL